MPEVIECPRLRDLNVNVPTAIRSSGLDKFYADTSMDQVVDMLRGASSVRSVTVGRNAFLRGPIQDSPTVVLPICKSLNILANVDEAVLAFFKSINVPLISYVGLQFITRVLRYTEPVFGTEKYVPVDDDSPSCCCRTISRAQMRQFVDHLSELAPILQSVLYGEIDLLVNTWRSEDEDTIFVTYEAHDKLVKKDLQRGICLTGQASPSFCTTEHQHVDLVSFAHMLSAFCWPSIVSIELKTSLASNASDEGAIPLHHDAFSTFFEEDAQLLSHNACQMTGVRTITIHLTQDMALYGIPLLTTLPEREGRLPWPELRSVRVLAVDNNKTMQFGKRKWWADVQTFLQRRHNAYSSSVVAIELVGKVRLEDRMKINEISKWAKSVDIV